MKKTSTSKRIGKALLVGALALGAIKVYQTVTAPVRAAEGAVKSVEEAAKGLVQETQEKGLLREAVELPTEIIWGKDLTKQLLEEPAQQLGAQIRRQFIPEPQSIPSPYRTRWYIRGKEVTKEEFERSKAPTAEKARQIIGAPQRFMVNGREVTRKEFDRLWLQLGKPFVRTESGLTSIVGQPRTVQLPTIGKRAQLKQTISPVKDIPIVGDFARGIYNFFGRPLGETDDIGWTVRPSYTTTQPRIICPYRATRPRI